MCILFFGICKYCLKKVSRLEFKLIETEDDREGNSYTFSDGHVQTENTQKRTWILQSVIAEVSKEDI